MKKKYLDLLQKLSKEKRPIYIFGGFAEDALLFGRTTRPHEDIDIIVLRKNLETYVKMFQSLGFKNYEIYLHNPSGQPTVLHSKNDGLAVELCIFDQNEGGEAYFAIYGETDEEKFCIYLPKDVFDYQKTSIDGVKIQTVSPLAQYHIRAGLGITKSFGGYRDKDIKSQKELKKKYFDDKSENELRPRVEKQQ